MAEGSDSTPWLDGGSAGKPSSKKKRGAVIGLVTAGLVGGGVLAGTLGGAAMGKDVIDFNHDDDSVTNTGQAIAAINVAAFGDVADFKASVDTLIRDIRGSARMPGVDKILVPGERSHATREARTRDGIPIPDALMVGLNKVADDLGMAKLA